MDNQYKFCDYIKILRKSKEYSLRKLSSILNISFSYLNDVETGRRAPFDIKTVDKFIETFELNNADKKYFIWLWITSQNKKTRQKLQLLENLIKVDK